MFICIEESCIGPRLLKDCWTSGRHGYWSLHALYYTELGTNCLLYTTQLLGNFWQISMYISTYVTVYTATQTQAVEKVIGPYRVAHVAYVWSWQLSITWHCNKRWYFFHLLLWSVLTWHRRCSVCINWIWMDAYVGVLVDVHPSGC